MLAEPIQTVMRRYNVANAYDLLKGATRGREITLEDLHSVIDNCDELPDGVKSKLKEMKPSHYTGLAEKLVDEMPQSGR